MNDRVKSRLESMGVIVPVDFDFTPLIDSVRAWILIEINHDELPIELESALVDAVAAQFLVERSATNAIEGFDVSKSIKSINEGDTSVTFVDGSSDAARIEKLAANLFGGAKRQWSAFRKMRW